MNYLYHIKPKNMKGNSLIPLNMLKKIHPEIYKNEIRKYEGRKSITKRIIPKLNCYWNDVIHLTAVHPRKLKSALKKAGSKKGKMEWIKINPSNLDSSKIIIYLDKYTNSKNINKKDIIKFSPNVLGKYNKIPTATLKYYKKSVKELKKPLLFYKVPHILYKGKLNIKNLEILEA